MRRSTLEALAPLLFALSVLACRGGGGSDAPRADPPPHVAALSGTSKKRVSIDTGDPEIAVRADYSLRARQLELHWVFTVDGLTDGSMLDPTKASSLQTVPLDLWPTEVAAVGPLQLAVAGISGFGETLVQIVTLELPSSLPSVSVDPLTGDEAITPLGARVASVRTVHRLPAEDSEPIWAMFQNRGASGRLFVVLHESRRMLELDTASGRTEPVAVPQGPVAPGAMLVPELAGDYTAVDDGDHQALGFLYWMHRPDRTVPNVLLFRDADRDGTLDSAQSITDWTPTYGEAGNYHSLR